MASIQVDATHFSPDTRAFIRLLALHEVQYLVVGGEAVILYGHARLTGDVDFFFANTPENTARLFAALDTFWDGDVPGLGSPGDLTPDGIVIQFGQPPNRIDLLNSIDGLTFAEAWPTRTEAVMVDGAEEVPLPYIGVDGLIKNKRAAGRPKDLDDVSYLSRDG